MDESDVMLYDHINKCRCCFRILISDQKSVQITKSIEQKFFELTQIELIAADIFSTKICQLCSNDLEVFHNFRNDLVQKQRKLYNSVMPPSNQENVMLKTEETNEFIECNGTNDEDLIDNDYHVKDEGGDQLMTSFEDGDGQEFKCQKCGFVSKSIKVLRNHEEQDHLMLQNLFCDSCNFISSSKSDLEQHMKLHTSKESQIFYCENCGLRFNKRHLLNRHVKIKHTVKERKFKCTNQNCDKAFFTISACKKHIESHSEKEIPCEYCGKLFSCLNNLRTHLYYHSEPKFVCDFEGCGKKFFMRKLLKAHINVHRGQKDFECEYCEKSYFFQAHLKRHILSTHMRLKIDCEICSSTFARKESYRNHVINQHQNLNSDDLMRLLTKIRNMKMESCQSSS